MDENKRKKLLLLGYEVAETCATCTHAKLTDRFGTCQRHTYEHVKHSSPRRRQLSISAFGSCKDYVRDEVKSAVEVGAYIEFMK